MRILAEYQADLDLQSGVTLAHARLCYATYGELDREASNAILFPTRFGAGHEANEFLIGPGRALDTNRFYVIVPNMLGNGWSSSPSNTAGAAGGASFPQVTIDDNVRFQHEMMTRALGIERPMLVLGWSMGAQQAYQWAARYPAAVPRLLVICGAARTAEHNAVFLHSLQAALSADQDFADGNYTTPPLRGLRAMGRIYAGWAYSQAWYREHCYQQMGFNTLEDYLPGYWDALFESREANDVMAMICTWLNHDISANERFGGDLDAALNAITADTLLMPCDHDLYFRTEDNRREIAALPHAELRELESIWGHMAGSGQNAADTRQIEDAIADLLARG